jgi:hypothetical protein
MLLLARPKKRLHYRLALFACIFLFLISQAHGGAFLKLVHQMGMYVIVRVGPYYNYLGPLAAIDPKGLDGAALLWDDADSQAPHWRTTRGLTYNKDQKPLATDSSEWREYTTGGDVFAHKQDVAWFQTTVQGAPGRHQFLELPDTGRDIIVYLNGQFVGKHPHWGEPSSLDLDPDLDNNSSAVVTLLVRNHEGSGRVGRGVRLISYAQERVVKGWRMRGGIAPLESLDWHSWKTEDQFQGPQFFRITFDAPLSPPLAPTPSGAWP